MGTETQSNTLHVQKHGKVTWVDVRTPDAETFAKLERDYHLHPVHLKESVQKIQHTQVERETNYLFVVLHFPVFHPRADKIFTGQIGVFLGKDFLVTVHNGASPFLEDLFEGCKNTQEHAEAYFKHSSAYLLYVVITKLLESISSVADTIEVELDDIEGVVFDNSTSDALRIGRVRQKIVRLRRLIGPKRMVLQDLTEQIGSFADHTMVRYYSNNVKTVNKLWEMIEEAKETVEIYKDADFTTSTEQTNRTLAILTLIFTFTIPITVLGTMYGMNVPLPGSLSTGPWAFFGRYTTGIVVTIVSIVAALYMYWYFHRKRWI